MQIHDFLNNFQALKQEKQHAFYEELSFEERDLFLKVIQNSGNVNNNKLNTLEEKLRKTEHMQIAKKENRLLENSFAKKIVHLIDEVAYQFHYITANKLDELVQTHFIEEWKTALKAEVLQNPQLIEFYISDSNTSRAEREYLINELKNNLAFANQIRHHPLNESLVLDYEGMLAQPDVVKNAPPKKEEPLVLNEWEADLLAEVEGNPSLQEFYLEDETGQFAKEQEFLKKFYHLK